MAKTKKDTIAKAPEGHRALLFVHAAGKQVIQTEWLDAIMALGYPVYCHDTSLNCVPTEHHYFELGSLLQELAAKAGNRPVILIQHGIEPTAWQIEAVAAALADSSCPAARTVLSNASPEWNPFAGLIARQRPESGSCARAVQLLGDGHSLSAVRWPGHFVALSPATVEILAQPVVTPANALRHLVEGGGNLELDTGMFLDTPAEPLFAAQRLEAHESPRPPGWGRLSAALQDWLATGAPDLPPVSMDGKPVTLHISHSWGGGVAQWVQTLIENDDQTQHLQLLAEGPQTNQGHGQRLSLYAGNRLECPLAQWWLQPAIQSIADRNAQYCEILEYVIGRFAVGRLIVSSLVGHSLDALRTGLPTVQVLHDYFPIWPLLSVHPDLFTGADGSIDLDSALDRYDGLREFPDLGVDGWRRIRTSYLDTLRAERVRVAAPTRSVVDLQRRLEAGWSGLEIEVIPHAFPPLPEASPVRPRKRSDGRLRLVILGRIQAGKGQQLLLEALPALTQYAHVYLLGTGKSGEEFFGIAGVDVVQQYDREMLPDILHDIGPHVAALLSVVPETFSFTLAELQHLGIPVIATRVGSFTERVKHGANGWLIEPTPLALTQQMASLFETPEELETMRGGLLEPDHVRPEDMVAAYAQLCPPAAPKREIRGKGLSLDQAQASATAFSALRARNSRLSLENAAAKLQKEVAERTEWALDTERTLKKITRIRDQIAAERDQAREDFHGARVDLDDAESRLGKAHETLEQSLGELADSQHKLQASLDDLEATRNALGESQNTLAETQNALGETQNALGETQNALGETRQTLDNTRIELRELQAAHQVSLARLKDTSRDLESLRAQFEQLLASSSWRITRPFRAVRRVASSAARARAWNPARWPMLLARLSHNLATVGLRGTLMRMQYSGQEGYGKPASEPVEPKGKPQVKIALPRSSRPQVSVVIPVYNKWDYTAACLRSIAETAGVTPCEIIVVDDASTDETRDSATAVEGLRYLRNPENLGFIGSCNSGAAEARGEFIIFLNNDTQVLEGWMESLVESFNRVADAGLVGAKLLYPDGSLQECGGLVFSDGSGWNYGRDDDPDKPEYQFLRETDYCSGACLMVRADLFRELNGFDTHFAPAYYEDTDLAFRVRQAGYKVLVQPRSRVIHHEGISSGTDVSSGVKRYQVENQEKFKQRWASELERHAAPIEDPTNHGVVRGARDHQLCGRVLIIDATTPEPDQDSGSMRMFNLMACFRELGYGVTFFADNRCHAGHYTQDLQDAGVEVIYNPWLESLNAFFEERGADFELVLASRHYIAINYVSLVRRHCPQAKFIFDTVDLHYLRERRLADLEQSASLAQIARQTRRSELSVIADADATLVVSSVEVDVLAEDAPGATVHVLSNIHEVPGCRTAFADRQDLFFVGGYQHPPNIDAMQWFVGEIWPLIRAELPEAKFHMIGSKGPEQVRALHGDGVVFHGFVKNLDQYLDGCRLAVAPLRYGAGVKGKVNMSMSHGQPVVATPAAGEGMHAEHGREIIVAGTAEEFAAEVLRLYRDEELWNRVSAASVKNVETHFSKTAARQSIRELLEILS